MIFNDLSSNSKVWIYISNQPIIGSVLSEIKIKFNNFLIQWKSHGENVNGQFQVIDKYIFTIAADVVSQNLCGRAVDAQVRFVKELSEEFQFGFLNRNNMAYLSKDGLKGFDFRQLEELVNNNSISEDTMWCNTFVKENKDNVYLPFKESPFASLYFSK
jgi:hypothetical protein